jgi:4-amino-4-deoxy-L-arabinose transferase-like glycosyltransferase
VRAPVAPVSRARIALALVLAKAAMGLAVLASGFTHVSDDDYARVVIAQGFAIAPRLDPSGTSWLPLPFWLAGSAMMVTGRSLLAARLVAAILGALSPLPALFALRRNGVSTVAVLGGLALAFASPWIAWSGVATIPDGWTAALVAAAAFALMGEQTLRLAAVCSAAAALSRYDAWPVCAVVGLRAGLVVGRAPTSPARKEAALSCLLAVTAPLLWMAWNRHSHGDALHFLARVASFRRHLGAADAPLGTKLAEYPRALWGDAPEALLLGLVGVVALVALPLAVRARLRGRWRWPLVVAAAVVAFLVAGDVRDGAPTHHPVRPLLGVVVILVVWGVDALVELAGSLPAARRRIANGALGLVATVIVAHDLYGYRQPPGTGDADRSAQIERGHVLQQTVGPSDVLQVSPCAYEHFALLASFGAPEQAVIEPGRTAGVGTGDNEECPRVTVEPR